mgnify:CR=1 FL=1
MFNHYRLNTLQLDPSLCVNCGLCVAVCPHGVFSPNGKKVMLARAGRLFNGAVLALSALAVIAGAGLYYAAMKVKDKVEEIIKIPAIYLLKSQIRHSQFATPACRQT